MMEKLEVYNSYYMPSFFRIKVGTYDDFTDMLSIPFGAYSLFFHEYIHYIQDITTIYGLMNLDIIAYYIQDVASRIGKEGNMEFKIPQDLEPREDYGVSNFLLKKIYMGTPINPKHKNIRIDSYQKRLYEDKDKEISIYIIEVIYTDTTTNITSSFELGGNHICEGMAYLCESYVYKPLFENNGYTFHQADDYPYNVCKLLTEQIYPEFAKTDDVLLVAVCDISLMTYHPGLSFIRLMEYLRKIDFLSTSYPKITDAVEELYKKGTTFLKGGHTDFTTIQNMVKEHIHKYFKCDEFIGNNRWIDTIFERANILRTNIPQFITDILIFGKGKDVRQNQFFYQVLGLLGTPLVINEENHGSISLPIHFADKTFMPGLFWAINQILKIFSDKNAVPCELKAHCKQSSAFDPEIKVDERCDVSPWNRCNDERLCPFAVMWKHWNLRNHIPVKESNSPVNI
ncbi:hypothetical protein [Phocaeicola vulgatus]|uniref:hypothetical protein n=2 Tax=Phocaeicola vulgatus TaxID=821 RepID=UPI003A7FA051